MAHFNPIQPLRVPCDGAGCSHYFIDDDGKAKCRFSEALYGQASEVNKISCPKAI